METYEIHQLEGVNRKTTPFIAKEGQVFESQNVDFSKVIGGAAKSGAYTQTGNQIAASKNILGMGMFTRAGGTYEHYAVCDGTNSEIYKNASGTWTSQSQTLTAAKRGYFTSMPELDFLFFCNLTDTTRGYSGAAWSASTNLTSAPKAQYLNAHETRLFLGNVDVGGTTYPTRYYFSASGTGGSFDTWDTTNDYYVLPEPISGFAENGENQLVFTQHSLFRADAYEKKQLARVGAQSQDVIVTAGDWTIFANRNGVYATDQSTDQKISQAIQPYFDGMSSIAAMRAAGMADHYYLYLDTVTLDGETLNKVLMDYDTAQNKWARYQLGVTVKVMGNFIDSNGVENIYIGNDNGEIFKLFSGATQDGSNYPSFIEFPVIAPNDSIQSYQSVKIWGKDLDGLRVGYKSRKSDKWSWAQGELRGDVGELKFFSPGELLYLRIEEMGQNSDFEIYKLNVGYNRLEKNV